MSNASFVDLLASFVPRLIQKRALENSAPIETAFSDELYAVVLFADISGFTALTEKLAQRGPVGVETLAHILNDYFGQLIDIVHKHGGDVVKFAGDALLVIWPLASTSGTADSVATEAQRQLTLRAAECALEICNKFLNYKTEEGTLYLKLALASGSLIETHIGGVFNRWEFALTGSPLVELGAANNLAKAGDILVSPSSLALIKNDCDFEKVEFMLNGETNPAARLIKLRNTSQLPAAK
ncbi:MAG: adenylate/guanylate cyclase domain-containing protein, partial [Chloroflexota bacterium]